MSRQAHRRASCCAVANAVPAAPARQPPRLVWIRVPAWEIEGIIVPAWGDRRGGERRVMDGRVERNPNSIIYI